MTERLYYDNPYQMEFEAEVVEQIRGNGHWLVRLSRSCFYPEGGGQPADRGFLNDIPVVDVQSENGEVYHYLPEKLAGPRLRGKIDFKRRFNYMQQHSGQHLISACFLQEGNFPTVSANLGSEFTTMELDCKTISEETLRKVEHRANEVIRQNVPIHCYLVSRTELKNIPLRKAPPGLEKIRIVEIENVDYSACGGTHVSRTGEIELVLYSGVEKIRGRVRVYWKIGRRAF
ncbi:MAG: alanyl-tRNA editing protein, partial [Calditrichia bacterium]